MTTKKQLIEALKAYIKDHDDDIQALGKDARMTGWQTQRCDCPLCKQAHKLINGA